MTHSHSRIPKKVAKRYNCNRKVTNKKITSNPILTSSKKGVLTLQTK